MGGYVQLNRELESEDLASSDRNAFTLLSLIAMRARYKEISTDRHGLKVGEAFIGDYARWGFTRGEYRNALKNLVKYNHLKIIDATNKGTTVKLCTPVFNINSEEYNNHQRNQRTTKEQPSSNQQATTKEERYKERKEENTPPTPHGGAEGGGDPSPSVPDGLTEEAEELRQEIVASGKVRKGALSPEAWALILRGCPEFDPGDPGMRTGLMSHVLCMDKKINGPASWFPSKMALVTKGAAPEADPEDYPNFQAWFEEYPKGARHPAFRMWVEMGMESRDLPELLRVLKAQKASEEWEDVTFVKHAKNYLKDRMFDDPLPEKNNGVKLQTRRYSAG
jgi:hypothetical protein